MSIKSYVPFIPSLEDETRAYWNSSVLQLSDATLDQESLRSAFDSPDLTSLGDVSGLMPGDTDGISLSVQPLFKPQSIDLILDNVNNFDWARPGLFIGDLGAKFDIDGIENSQLEFELFGHWDDDEPRWGDVNPSAAVKLKLLDVHGGTIQLNATGEYDLGDSTFDSAAYIQFQVQF